MTQTPRGYDPNDPNEALPARYPGAADQYAEPSGVASGPGGAGYNTATPTSGTDVVSAAPAAGEDAHRRGTPEAAAPGTETEPEQRRVTRAGMVWVAVASALVVLILLIVFILQNQDYILVKFFGLEGSVPLGIALFIAAVGGGVLVAIAGAARIIQLRLAAHRQRVSRQAGAGTRTR